MKKNELCVNCRTTLAGIMLFYPDQCFECVVKIHLGSEFDKKMEEVQMPPTPQVELFKD